MTTIDPSSPEGADPEATGNHTAGNKDAGAKQGSAKREDLTGLDPQARSKATFEIILDELADDKAEEIVEIDLLGKSDIGDAMVIASGRSQRHVGAMADKIIRRLKEAGHGNVRSEGQPACDWVLIDAEDVIVHIFRPEVRSFYNLERIWSEDAKAASKVPAADSVDSTMKHADA